MALSHTAKTKLRRFCVWLKYLFPFAETVLVWILCALPLWRFSNGDGTTRVTQSIFTILQQTGDSVTKTLAKTNAEASDVLLAKSLRPLPYIFWILMAAVTLSAFLLFCFSWAALSRDPESNVCNRVKVKFRLFFPGKLWHVLLPVLTALPCVVPYYILNRFAQYYAASGTAETEGGGQTFTYYTYTLHTEPFNALAVMAVLAGIGLILYFAVKPWERSQKMDMYRYYEAEKTAPEPQKKRKNI